MLDTALLLTGVAALSLSIGAGTAWTVSLHEFRGRRLLLWLLPLPLAIPTYLAAYVYVDLFEPLGLVHRALTTWFSPQDVMRALPNLRSLPGAIIVIALVLYPYVYLSARTMFQFQSAEFAEAARTLGAGRWTTFWRHLLAVIDGFHAGVDLGNFSFGINQEGISRGHRRSLVIHRRSVLRRDFSARIGQ